MNAYENSYDLDYEDGDSESRVPARYIRPLAPPRELSPTPLTTTSQTPPGRRALRRAYTYNSP